jgi:hypothetical protein
MRINPIHDSTCWMRIGMYREEACYNCKFLSECDLMYDEESDTWDYIILPLPQAERKRKCGPNQLKVKKGGVYDTM